ncbi:hypothetical protein C8Q80DRAFT_1124365 [Daedaleopsis nitida]|nr:hypothetical protein C8Q80DRAFT_1124365 [Daedaleopsis nitida]
MDPSSPPHTEHLNVWWQVNDRPFATEKANDFVGNPGSTLLDEIFKSLPFPNLEKADAPSSDEHGGRDSSPHPLPEPVPQEEFVAMDSPAVWEEGTSLVALGGPDTSNLPFESIAMSMSEWEEILKLSSPNEPGENLQLGPAEHSIPRDNPLPLPYAEPYNGEVLPHPHTSMMGTGTFLPLLAPIPHEVPIAIVYLGCRYTLNFGGVLHDTYPCHGRYIGFIIRSLPLLEEEVEVKGKVKGGDELTLHLSGMQSRHSNLTAHMKECHDPTFKRHKCNLCEKSYNRSNDLKRHKEKRHP